MQQDIKIPSNLYPIRTIEASSTTYPVVHQDGNYYVDIPYTRPGEAAAIVFYDQDYNRISDLNWQLVSGNTIRIYIGSDSYDKIYLALYNEVNQLPENYLELFCLDNITSGLRKYRLAVGKKKFPTANINVGDMLDELVQSIEGGLLSQVGSLGEYQRQAGQARNNLGIYSKYEIDRNLFQKTDVHNIYDLNATIPDKTHRTGNQICVADEFLGGMYPGATKSYRLLPEFASYYPSDSSSLVPAPHIKTYSYGILPVCTAEDYNVYQYVNVAANADNMKKAWKNLPSTNIVRLNRLFHYNEDTGRDYTYMLSVNLHCSLPKIDRTTPYQVSYCKFNLVSFESYNTLFTNDVLNQALNAYVDSLPSSCIQSMQSILPYHYIIYPARFRTEFKSVAYNSDFEYEQSSTNSRISKYSYDGSQAMASGTRESRSIFGFTSKIYDPIRPSRVYYGDLYPSSLVSQVDVGGADTGWNVRWEPPFGGTIPPLASQETNTVNAYLCYEQTGSLARKFGIFIILNSSIHNYGELDMVPEPNISLSGSVGDGKWGNNEYWLTGDILLW